MTTLASGENETIAMIRRCWERQQGEEAYDAGVSAARSGPGERVMVSDWRDRVAPSDEGVEGAEPLPPEGTVPPWA